MYFRKSKVKAKLARNQPVMCSCLHFTDPSIYEIVGHLGWDVIWMDLEHHGYSVETAQHMMRGARVGGTDIMARPAKGEFMRMGRLLESGAHGILYPRCDNADEAAEVVRWSKFAPMGQRGVDAANPDNPYLMTPLAEYLKLANDNTWIALQIEDPKAMDQVEKIAAVPGIDVLFLGPGDFSVLAGIPGQMSHPIMLDAIKRIAAAAKAHGKHWGMPVPTPERGKELLDMGARFIAHGSDFVLLKTALEGVRERMKAIGMTFDQGPLT
jgi:4-hydroxy-2-oxoheptanedioate aldolase